MAAIAGSISYEQSHPNDPGRDRKGGSSKCPTPSQIVDQHRLAVNLMEDLAEQVASLAYCSESSSAAKWSLTLQFVAEGICVLGEQMSAIARAVDRKPGGADEGEAPR
jgi:hypothetical protein